MIRGHRVVQAWRGQGEGRDPVDLTLRGMSERSGP